MQKSLLLEEILMKLRSLSVDQVKEFESNKEPLSDIEIKPSPRTRLLVVAAVRDLLREWAAGYGYDEGSHDAVRQMNNALDYFFKYAVEEFQEHKKS